MPLALVGTGVSRGIGIGHARVLHRGRPDIPQYVLPPALVESEVERLELALEAARSQLRAIRDQIPAAVAGDISSFIDTHLLMLEDSSLTAAPVDLIRRHGYNAEWALKLQQDALIKIFEEIEDSYLRTRRDDVEHVVWRVQHILLDGPARHDSLNLLGEEEERVILAEDLSPGELVLLHRQKVAGIVTDRGGPASHVAILARSLGIPALVGVRRPDQYIEDGETVVVDGDSGVLLAGLDPYELASYRRRQTAERRRRAGLRRLRETPAVSRDGVPVELHINVELEEDLLRARHAGAAGVGLYRTEFLYMNRLEPPSEEEQFERYLEVVRAMEGAPVTIRTLDAGADKQIGAASDQSCTSALGLRAIRLCLKELDLFRPQLRAILRASAFGPVRLMIPMLTTVREIEQVQALVAETRRELSQRGIAYDPALPVGGMIEVPAAALCVDQFARRLDFLSIGTNDLTQYTLAADRMDQGVSHLYDPLHPAVLQLIRMTAVSGECHGKPVSVCGEVAGDAYFTRLLLGLGVTRLSMPPGALLEVKRVVLDSDVGRLRGEVERLLGAPDAHVVAALMEEINAG